MLRHNDLELLVDNLSIVSYKAHVATREVTLSEDMAAALGQHKRKLVRVLKSVIDAISNKLFIERIAAASNQDVVDTWLRKNRITLLQREIFKAVVRDGVTYVLVKYQNDAPVFTLIDSFNGKDGATYAKIDGVTVGINTWIENDKRHLDVYYPDRIEKYILNDEWDKRRDIANEAWPIDYTDNNDSPLGIPLVRFSIGESDIVDALQIQHDINDALLDLVAVSRTMGFPQRILKGSNSNFYDNGLGQTLVDQFNLPMRRQVKVNPGSILKLDKEDSIEQLAAATPDSTVLDQHLRMLSLVTTVPTFYLDGSEMPSGVALIQAESRLNTKVENHSDSLTDAFIDLLRISMRLSNTYSRTNYDANQEIELTWYPPEIETEDLRMDKEKARFDNAFKAFTAGFLSAEDAIRYAFPDADETTIQAMTARVKGEKALLEL